MEQLDPQIINLAKAIRDAETGNSPKPGASGELTSRYQFEPGTWAKYAGEILGDANAPLTLENENKVAYYKIKQWKDQGYNVGQIASMWNAGEGNPDAYANNHRGVNSAGVAYDTPAYAKRVADKYHELKAQDLSYNPTPFSNPTNPATQVSATVNQPTEPENQTYLQDLGGHITDRLNKGAANFNDLISKNPEQMWTSNIIQGLGEIGGGINDVVNTTIEHTPVLGGAVKALEGWIGKGVNKFSQTETGQKVIGAVDSWIKEDPERAKNVEGVVNIATAIPILKGFATAGNLALKGAGNVLKKQAIKITDNALTNSVATTAGQKALKKAGGSFAHALGNGAIPELVTTRGATRWSTTNAQKLLEGAIGKIDDLELQPLLDSANTGKISTQVAFKDVIKEGQRLAVDELHSPDTVTNLLERVGLKYGDFPSLSQLNEAKRLLSRQISESAFDAPGLTDKIIARKALQTAIEDGAAKLGLGDVNAINQRMSSLIRDVDLLRKVDGKTVPRSALSHNLIKGASTAAGAGIGTALGGQTLVGAALGFTSANSIENQLIKSITKKGIATTLLKKAATTPNNVTGRLGGMLGAAMTQKASQKALNK